MSCATSFAERTAGAGNANETSGLVERVSEPIKYFSTAKSPYKRTFRHLVPRKVLRKPIGSTGRTDVSWSGGAIRSSKRFIFATIYVA